MAELHTLLHRPGPMEILAIDRFTSLAIAQDGRSVSIRSDSPAVEVRSGSMAAAEHFIEQLLSRKVAPSAALHLAPYGISADGGVYWGRTVSVAGARSLTRPGLPVPLPRQGEHIVFPLSANGSREPDVHVVEYGARSPLEIYSDGWQPEYLSEIRKFGAWLAADEYSANGPTYR